MQNLLSLANRLEKVADNLPKKINDGKKAIVLKIVSYLADITPVDTSNALFIANNAPYISDLNAGSSKQHPGGFVEAAILIGRLEINNIKVVYK